jgi:hypothetical protein
MHWSDIPFNPSPRQLRHFGVLAALIAAGWSVWGLFTQSSPAWTIGTGATATVTLLIACVKPSVLRWPFVGLVVVTFPIGWLVSQAILGLIFYGLITPLAVYYRWRGRDELRLRPPSAGEETFWERKETASDPRSYHRQF